MKPYFNIVVLFLSAGILLSCSNQHKEEVKKDPPIVVTVATAGNQSNHVVQGSGQIVSGETAIISTRVMGYVTGILVKIGDTVKKGQLLVTISNSDMLAKRAQAQALVAEAEAALSDAKKDYLRYTELYSQQSASKKELENITLQYTALKAKAEAAKQLENEVDAMLSYTNLKAPFTGIVAQKNMDPGSMAGPGMPILTLEKLEGFQVNTSVTEADVHRINVGADAQIFIASIGKMITGKVAQVSPSSQMSGGQYLVKVSIPEHEKNGLRSGMYGKVLMTGSGKLAVEDNITVVPESAIVYKDQLNGLYTISDDQTALLRWVKLGRKHGDQIEVLSGLRENEKFIVAADGKLYNGVPVMVK